MKKILFYLVATALIAACSTKPQYSITGNIDGLADGIIYLKQISSGKIQIVDSVKSSTGKFEFKGSVSIPSNYVIVLGERRQFSLFLENSIIQVTGKFDDLRNVTIIGSSLQDEMKSVYKKSEDAGKPMKELYGKLDSAEKAGDKALQESLIHQIDSIDALQSNILKGYITENSNSFVAPVILQQIQYGMEAEELDSYLKKFSPEVMKSAAATTLAGRVVILKSVAVGNIAPDFALADSTGTSVKLSEIYSKNAYTLIDFWASWCGPCRRENPNVVAVWKDFNAKGFNVLGVSCDSDRAKWLQAIASDQLTWNHLSDLKGWNNEAAKLYGINSIPANLLVDRTGKIVAKNLREAKLREKIAELLK